MSRVVLSIITLILSLCSYHDTYAATLQDSFDGVMSSVEQVLNSILFVKILHIPLIVLLLMSSAIFCTIKFRFVNVRLFMHAISILFGKNSDKNSKGDINHFQAFTTAVAGTVGLGTVSGVAVAVTIGGPGAVMWMVVAGFIGMSSKFSEVTLGFKYRTEDSNHHKFGGPFQYINIGMAGLGYSRLGKVLSSSYAVLLILSAFVASIPFQANQTISIIKGYNGWVDNHIWVFALILTALNGLVILGGIKRIANVSSKLVPLMAFIYISSCLVIILYHYDRIGHAFSVMISEMIHGNSALGGFMGSFVAGIRRAVFANEAGIGTAPIAHAATKDNHAVRAGLVAMLEPCIDTMVICFLTGLVITVTGVYETNSTQEGILLTREAFATVSSWFPVFLSISVPFFAFSTIIAFSYYCEMGWLYLFKSNRSIIYCRMMILTMMFLSAISNNFMSIAKLGDMLFMTLAIPNIIAMYCLNNQVNADLKKYQLSLKK